MKGSSQRKRRNATAPDRSAPRWRRSRAMTSKPEVGTIDERSRASSAYSRARSDSSRARSTASLRRPLRPLLTGTSSPGRRSGAGLAPRDQPTAASRMAQSTR